MAKTNYLDQSDDGFAHQLITFKNAIGAYATALGLTRPGHRAGGRRRLFQLRPRGAGIDGE